MPDKGRYARYIRRDCESIFCEIVLWLITHNRRSVLIGVAVLRWFTGLNNAGRPQCASRLIAKSLWRCVKRVQGVRVLLQNGPGANALGARSNAKRRRIS